VRPSPCECARPTSDCGGLISRASSDPTASPPPPPPRDGRDGMLRLSAPRTRAHGGVRQETTYLIGALAAGIGHTGMAVDMGSADAREDAAADGAEPWGA
jgi:hypothetical protein